MRALVIDDSKAIRMILCRMLKSAGLEPAQAEHGQAAIDWLESNGPVDIALVDWNMPVMDGLTFVQRVRADGRYRSMKIAMVTTETEISQVQRALQAGADEYVMKPFTPDVVLEKLKILGLPVGQR